MTLSGRSLINITNSTDPCGIPDVTGFHADPPPGL